MNQSTTTIPETELKVIKTNIYKFVNLLYMTHT